MDDEEGMLPEDQQEPDIDPESLPEVAQPDGDAPDGFADEPVPEPPADE